MKQISLILGIISIIGMVIGLIPCMGWFNWLNLPFAIVGLILGYIAYKEDQREAAINYGPSMQVKMPLGLILSGTAVVIGTIRLFIGFGVF